MNKVRETSLDTQLLQKLLKQSNKTLSTLFSKIFIINLPERTDRKHEILRMLEKNGIDTSVVSFFTGIRPQEVASFRTLGAHGCFLSHLKILELAQEQNLDSVLIMEDDLEIIKSFTLIEKQVVNSLKLQKWDLVYFGHILKLDPVKNFRFEPYYKDILQTHFVGFNRQIIPLLINFLKGLLLLPPANFSQPWRIDVDGAYTLFREKYPSIVTLVANPSLGYQRSSRGDITPYKWFDQPGVLRTCTEKYRLIKRIFKHYLT